MHQVCWYTTKMELKTITTPGFTQAFTIYCAMRLVGIHARLWLPKNRLFAN